MTDSKNAKEPQKLEFTDEPGSSRSKWVAGLLALALAGWMGSGFVLEEPAEDVAAPVQEIEKIAVAVQDSVATEVTKTFSAEGQAQPDRRATVRSQTSGEVDTLSVSKGDTLEAGDEIARLSTRELEARVQEAQEKLNRARQDHENAQALFDRGSTTATRLRITRAELAGADAQLAQSEEALDAAIIRAPFAGRLDKLELEIGSFVSSGAEIGTILDTDPLRIIIQVPQHSLAQIHEGQEADVTFITGEKRVGTIDYVSRDAESETRTFRAEINVPNEGSEIASGLSVQVRIPTEQVIAHFISPAILSLGEDGRLGLKTVDETNKVVFHEVVVERAQRDGIWVSGLPENARIITIGQGFVSDGEIVNPINNDDDIVSTDSEPSGETQKEAD